MNAAQEREVLMDERERQFDALIREYLMDNGTNEFGDGRKFRFGGAVNLLATVRMAFADAYKQTNIPGYQYVASELERIVACANACAGIPTGMLEAAGQSAVIALRPVDELVAERNALLAALVKIKGLWSGYAKCSTYASYLIAIDAIAKVKP